MEKKFVDNFKDIFGALREYLGLKYYQIYQGLCSEETGKKYENGKLSPDLFLFFMVVERLGISSERFEIVLPDEYHIILLWYENCIRYAENRDVKRFREERAKFNSLFIINRKIQFQQKEFIDYILSRFFDKNLENALNHIIKAIQYTIENIDEIISENCYLSMFEWHLLTNYFDTLYLNKEGDKTDISKKIYELSQYLSGLPIDDLIKSNIMPKLVLVMLKQDKEFLTVSERLELLNSILKMSVHYMRVREVNEILYLLIQEEPAYYKRNTYFFWKSSLESIFEFCGLKIEFRIEIFNKNMKYHVLSYILKQKRKKLGMTVEEVSDNICDVKTYLRMERGKGLPHKSILKAVAEKLGLEFRYFRAEVDSCDIQALFLANECRRLSAICDKRGLMTKVAELEKGLNMNNIVNRQEIEFIKLTLNQEMDKKEKIEQSWKIFNYTKPEFNVEESLSIKEIEILTYIASIMTQEQILEKINLIELIVENAKNYNFLDYYSRLSVPLVNLVCAYKDNKEYEKAHFLGIDLLKMCYKSNDASFLLNIIDYLSTIEEENGNIKMAKELCKNLFYIAELYEKYCDTNVIRAYYEKVFSPNEAWYSLGE